MSIVANIHDAKTNLSRLIAQAVKGEEVIIAKAGEPKVKIVPIKKEEVSKRIPGRWSKSKIWIADDFDEVDKKIEDMFYNSPIFPDEKK